MPAKSKVQVSEVVEQTEDLQNSPIILLPPEQNIRPLRTLGLIGDVDEEKAAEVIQGLITLHQTGKIEDSEEAPSRNKKPKKVQYEPLEFYLSTHGGNASDMFAIYDVMRMIRKDCEISTVGIGKVMSAGVLLLAAGTKGKRKIGRNCRVMIHSVLGGHQGPIHSLENEMGEIRWTQDTYVNSLIAETKLTKTTMNKLLEKHVNIYLSAEEAVKYGIADEVI